MVEIKWTPGQFERAMEKLAQIPIALRSKAGRSAAGKAMAIVKKAAIANASRIDDEATANRISKNVAQQFVTRYQRQTGDLKVRVGILGGARDLSAHGEIRTNRTPSANPGGDTFYWRFLEFGTEKMRARPFMLPALEDNADRVMERFAIELEKAIDRIAKKTGGA